MVSVAEPVALGLTITLAGEKLDPQPRSPGREEESVKERGAQAMESLFLTDTVKLTGEPAFTDVLVGEIVTVGLAAVHGGVLYVTVTLRSLFTIPLTVIERSV